MSVVTMIIMMTIIIIVITGKEDRERNYPPSK